MSEDMNMPSDQLSGQLEPQLQPRVQPRPQLQVLPQPATPSTTPVSIATSITTSTAGATATTGRSSSGSRAQPWFSGRPDRLPRTCRRLQPSLLRLLVELQQHAKLAYSCVQLTDNTVDIFLPTSNNKYELDKALQKQCSELLKSGSGIKPKLLEEDAKNERKQEGKQVWEIERRRMRWEEREEGSKRKEMDRLTNVEKLAM